ncbi:MAG: MFS transporter [Sphingobium sp.]
MKPISPDHSAGQQEEDGLPVPRRYRAAIAMWLAISMTVLDSALANVALPTIARQLHAPAAASIWIVNAYQLAIAMLLLPLAALGDRIGYRRVYLPGLALFIIGSVACALSHSLPALVASRMFQGIGAAAVMSMNGALARTIYPNALLGRGIGYNALVLSISAAIGPTLAALILSIAPWPWLFAINLPLGLTALLIGAKALPDMPGDGQRFDYPSALLSALTLASLILGAETLAREGVGEGGPVMLLGLLCGAALLRRERHRPAPLVPLDLLRMPVFALSIATSITSFAAQMLAFVSLPFLFQTGLGRSVVETGSLMTPWPLAVAFAAPLAGRLADRYPAGLLGGIGLALFAAGLVSLSFLGAASGPMDIAWRMALCGLGFGFFQSPNNRTMMSAAPRARSGAAGGMLATARLLGQTTGAVTVAAGFHWLGVGSGPVLLRMAAGAALVGALFSLSRLRTPLTPMNDGFAAD